LEHFRLKVLGTPSVTAEDGSTPPSLGWGKPLALLCLLAVRGEVRREEVVDLLWRDVEESKARNAFRQALHRLRTALGDKLLPQDRERVRLVRSTAIEVDVDEFEKAIAAARLDDAVRLYAGDFLENSELGEPAFDQWCEHERARLQARFRQALQDAVAQSSSAGRWAESIARARRLQALAPFDAGAAQLAATTMVSAGRRVEALELLRHFAARLQADLGLPLPAELQALATRLERQPFGAMPAPNAGTPAALADLELRFAGREAELSRLLSMWRSTAIDAGSLALVEGSSGIGKSRLVRELAAHAKSLGRATVLSARERATGVALPFGVFAEALRPLVRASGVAGASRHLLAEAARLLPELRDNFDLPPVSDVADEASRVRFFEGVAALIDAAAYEQPVLMVLEDLHAVTPSSLDLLTYLCARLAGSAVMFVLTVRDADAPAAVAGRLRALAEENGSSSPHGARAKRLVLGAIPPADAAQITSDAGRALGLAEIVVSRIALRSEGNPGRVTALLRLAAEGDELNATPVSMRDMVAARLQQLPSAQRRFFVAIALIGRPVSSQLAADVGHVTLAAAREAAAILEHNGLVERLSDDVFIATELAAHVATDAAGAASRTFLAGWIVDALSRDTRANPAELARFYAMAGQAAPAFEHARRAAYAAIGVGAVAEAVQWLTSARTFASTPEEQEQIESFLAALGSGRRRIGAPGIVSQPIEPPRAEPAPTATQTPRASDAVIDAGPLERLFPNWRVLFGAAVATLLITSVVLASRDGPTAAARAQFADTLVLSDGQNGRGVRYVIGDPVAGLSMSGRVDAPQSDPPWLDSLSRPWSDVIPAPNGRAVAAARLTAQGSDVYVLSGNRRDANPVIVGLGDSRPLAWSPDGRWLLASTGRRRQGGAFDSDLRAYRLDVAGAKTARTIDTVAGHATAEAAWSPDGSRIAWVARVGSERQLEVFVSLADGSEPRNVSRHPADDSHIAWSSDGELLAFTSTRDGNAELYAMGVRENRLWRLTRDPAQDDRGSFSRNGRLIAFESTRGGSAGVYVMPGLGGDAQRVAGGPALGILGWRAGRARYVDRVRVEPAAVVQPGETTSVRLMAVDQFDEALPSRDVAWTVLDSTLASLANAPDSAPDARLLITKRAGLARVVGTASRWRADTAFVRIGSQSVDLIEPTAQFAKTWSAFGSPAPRSTAPATVVLNADRQWDSGILSTAALPLLTGLTISVLLDAPLSDATDVATAVTIAIVAPENAADIQQDAPQFLKYASISWSAGAGRLVYAVGQETYSEPVPAEVTGLAVVQLAVESDSTMSFSIDGRQRWRSSLRVLTMRNEPRAQLWIGGRATGERVRVSGIAVSLRP
jgi:DNA-binding SARP family transcriptional activator